MTVFFFPTQTSELKKIIFLNGILILVKLLLKTMLFKEKREEKEKKKKEAKAPYKRWGEKGESN